MRIYTSSADKDKAEVGDFCITISLDPRPEHKKAPYLLTAQVMAQDGEGIYWIPLSYLYSSSIGGDWAHIRSSQFSRYKTYKKAIEAKYQLLAMHEIAMGANKSPATASTTIEIESSVP